MRLWDLPLLVILLGLTALAMLAPAVHGYAVSNAAAGRPFFYAACGLGMLTVMIGLATVDRAARDARHSHLAAMIGAYLILPPIMAVPFAEAVADTSFVNAWFEMLSCFTTTGATLYEGAERIPETLHLWRVLVGWLGGFFILLMAVAVLMPMNLGGMEVLTGRSGRARGPQDMRIADATERIQRFAVLLFPPYAGFTLLLWFALVLMGEPGFRAFAVALSTLSTSGILPGGGTAVGGFGVELIIAAFLLLGITRRAYPGALFDDPDLSPWRDPEVQMAGAIILSVTLVLALRHWVGAIENSEGGDLPAFVSVLWGAAYTTLSFLTTTGFTSEHWGSARIWSGLETHGMILMGLAIVGGGVATTAGGVKLLRVYALFRQGQTELARLVHPHGVVGGGASERHLRGEGALVAWVFFMLFAMSIGVVAGALTLVGLAFDPALILSISALTTTGQLAAVAAEAPVRYSELGTAAKAILGGAMILGRVEALAVLALLAPDQWRR